MLLPAGMPASLSKGLETANIVLTALFTFEVILKLMGLGIWDYISDGFNIFDAIVVIISLVELAASAAAGGLSSLRCGGIYSHAL